MKIDLAKLGQMVAIADAGSFSRAADELGITQPALSRNIAQIERQYGFRIFDRGRGGASLTHAGSFAVEEAKDLLIQARSLERNYTLYGRGDGGYVNFGMGPAIAELLLHSVTMKMQIERPNLRTNCSIATGNILLPMLRRKEMEMIFCAVDHVPNFPDIEVEAIASVEMGLFVRANHPLASEECVGLERLRDFPIAMASDRLPGSVWDTKGAIICQSASILMKVVLGGEAFCLTIKKSVEDLVIQGLISEINLTDIPVNEIQIGVVRIKGRSLSPSALRIIDNVCAFLDKPQNPHIY